ncbi:hypothetical protein ACFL2D_03000 [Patescibacteria group bacterium]
MKLWDACALIPGVQVIYFIIENQKSKRTMMESKKIYDDVARICEERRAEMERLGEERQRARDQGDSVAVARINTRLEEIFNEHMAEVQASQ